MTTLARRLALRKADGSLATLPRFTVAADPLVVRAHLLAFYELRDCAQRERAHLGSDATVSARIAWASVAQEIDDAIQAARACLRRMARLGGRGVPPVRVGSDAPGTGTGAGRSPAVMAHGCAAFASAVGPAPASTRAGEREREACNTVDIITPADPLFCGQQVQELPPCQESATVTQQGEEASC